MRVMLTQTLLSTGELFAHLPTVSGLGSQNSLSQNRRICSGKEGWKGKRCHPPTSMAVRPYTLFLLFTQSQFSPESHPAARRRGLVRSPAVRAFGGGSPVREVGTSSCWAPPPSRQPQRGSAAPYHGRLGAMTRWGDNVRVEGSHQWYAARQSLAVRPEHLLPPRRTGGAGREGTWS